MNGKACLFIGHGRLWGMARDLEGKIDEEIGKLVTERGVTVFFCGGMGEFDALCAACVRKAKKRTEGITLNLIIPYLTQDILSNGEYYHSVYDAIVNPGVFTGKNYKSVITERNRWMVEQSQYAVCYVKDEYGGARKTFEYAKKRGVEVINLS